MYGTTDGNVLSNEYLHPESQMSASVALKINRLWPERLST